MKKGFGMNIRPTVPLWIAFGLLQFLSCSDEKIVVGDQENRVIVTQVFAGGAVAVDSVLVDWAPNGSEVVFAGHPPGGAGQIYRVPAGAGALPVAVTDPQANEMGATGFTPGFLMDGRIVFFAERTSSDPEVRIMVAAPGTIENTPPAELLHHFTAADVGLAAMQPPSEMSYAGDGWIALGRWEAGYTLAWDAGEQLTASTQPEYGQALTGTLTRDGTRIAYETTDGKIAHQSIDGGAIALVGEGHCPSWDEYGTLIGFITTDCTAYTVFNTLDGSSRTYLAPEGVILHLARLSMCGTMIAFRTQTETGSGIAVGALSAAPG